MIKIQNGSHGVFCTLYDLVILNKGNISSGAGNPNEEWYNWLLDNYGNEDKLSKLQNLLNDYEKYIKIIFYTICKMLGALLVKTELEIEGKYADILLIPREKIEERYGVLIEFKYIKQEDYDKNPKLLKKKQKEAKEQIEKYKETEEIKVIPKLRSYSVVAIKDKLIIEEE